MTPWAALREIRRINKLVDEGADDLADDLADQLPPWAMAFGFVWTMTGVFVKPTLMVLLYLVGPAFLGYDAGSVAERLTGSENVGAGVFMVVLYLGWAAACAVALHNKKRAGR